MPDRKKDKNMVKELQVVIFRLAGEEYGLDISQAREIIRVPNITPMPKAPSFIEGVINLRGQIIAVMDLAERFGLNRSARTEKARIVIAEIKGNMLGLVVDEVSEVLRISESDIDPAPEAIQSQIHADFIKGVGRLKDRIIVLLDVDRVLSHEEALKAGEVSGDAE